MRRIHRQFRMERRSRSYRCSVQQKQVSTHACPLRSVPWTPTLLGMEGDFVRSLRYPVADSSRAVRQCKSPHHLPAPGSDFRASSYFVLHTQPGSSIGLGLIPGVAIHGAMSANFKDSSSQMRPCSVTAGKQFRQFPVDLEVPIVRIDCCSPPCSDNLQ